MNPIEPALGLRLSAPDMPKWLQRRGVRRDLLIWIAENVMRVKPDAVPGVRMSDGTFLSLDEFRHRFAPAAVQAALNEPDVLDTFHHLMNLDGDDAATT